MNNLSIHLPSLRQEIKDREAATKGLEDDNKDAKRHHDAITRLKALLQDLEDFLNADRNFRFSLLPSEVDDLPPEQLAEININKSDRQDFQILEVLDNAGGAASIDQIMVALHRKTGMIQRRVYTNSRLYRMIKKRLIYPVPNFKGAYSLNPIEVEGEESDEEEQDSLTVNS